MKIETCLFYSFWAIISIIFLNLGFNAFERTHLSESVPPVIVFLFKHAFAISVISSTDFRLFVSVLEQDDGGRSRLFQWFILMYPLLFSAISGFSDGKLLFKNPFFYLCLSVSIGSFDFASYNFGFESATIGDWIAVWVDTSIKTWLLCFGHSWTFIPEPVLLISNLVSPSLYSYVMRPQSFSNEMLPLSEGESRNTTFEPSKKMKFTEFAIGTAATAIFQNFFQFKTFDHVLTFLYFAVAWLGNVAQLGPIGDFGVFRFLLTNVIVGSAVGKFGLGGKSWIAYGAAVFLYLVRLFVVIDS